MRKILIMACMMFGSTLATKANDNKLVKKNVGDKKTNTLANERAKLLSDEMIRGLHLNNYQSGKIREINLKVAEQITAIEQEHAGNQAKIEALSAKVYAERDRYLEDVLSTVQYNDYFGHRKDYTAMDKEFAAQASQEENSNNATAGTTATSGANSVNVN